MAQKIRVMLVDDSAIVRGLMQRALSADPAMEIVATAVDGQMALDFLKRTQVDIIILDIEMPVMDGLTALPQLMKLAPNTRIIMASTLTMRNAEISLKALQLGAADYLAKPSATGGTEVQEFYRQLIAKVKALAPAAIRTALTNALNEPPLPVAGAAGNVRPVPNPMPAGALAIASSTGGPQALMTVFEQMKGRKLRVPVFITQHMPPTFTTILATHISKASGHDCHEAKDGETVVPGVIYVAPGDYHMTVERVGAEVKLKLDQNPQENFCRPAADPMLRSLAKVYGAKLLVSVLTGIGADGTRGAADAVAAGGIVVTQDEASCIVYGMPRAIAEAKLASAILPLNQMGSYLAKAVT